MRVDIRGSGESDGLLSDEYARQEQDDALEVIAWLAAQPWCSGAVGMMGISWGGFNALQVAARRPPALKAIITLCSTDDRYRDDVHYMGGRLAARRLRLGLVPVRRHVPPARSRAGRRPLARDVAGAPEQPAAVPRALAAPSTGATPTGGTARCARTTARSSARSIAVGGWTDGYTNAIPRLLAHLTVPRKGLIGPWAHAYPHFALPGPQIGFLQEALRWWDHWLKGIDTGVMDEPMLRAWMTDSVRARALSRGAARAAGSPSHRGRRRMVPRIACT